MSYNNQLQYKPDYGYADALLKVNPFKQIAEPFEKMEAVKGARAKAALDAQKTLTDIAKTEADAKGVQIDNLTRDSKNNAEIDVKTATALNTNAQKNKTLEEIPTIVPKAFADIALKNAQKEKTDVEAGLLPKKYNIDFRNLLRQEKDSQNERENRDLGTSQRGLLNLSNIGYLDEKAKRLQKGGTIGSSMFEQ